MNANGAGRLRMGWYSGVTGSLWGPVVRVWNGFVDITGIREQFLRLAAVLAARVFLEEIDESSLFCVPSTEIKF